MGFRTFLSFGEEFLKHVLVFHGFIYEMLQTSTSRLQQKVFRAISVIDLGVSTQWAIVMEHPIDVSVVRMTSDPRRFDRRALLAACLNTRHFRAGPALTGTAAAAVESSPCYA